MPMILDIFNNRQFQGVELTDAINVVPNTYGRVNEIGLFRDEPVATTSVAIQFANQVLNLLPTRERGGPASLGMPEKRNVRSFVIPHIPHEDFVTAGEVQNALAMSGGLGNMALENVQSVVNRKLLRMRAKHAITLEHMRMASLKGILIDNDGSTLFNWFTEFGVTQTTVNFPFSVGTTNVAGIVRSILRSMEDNAFGETVTGARAFVSPEFFDALISHASVTTAYQYFAQAGANPLNQDVRPAFPFGGITFEEYRGSATQQNEDKTTTVRKFVPASEGIAFPTGTQETFVNYWAPPDFIETVNLASAQQVFVKQAVDPEFQRWVKLHTQSNPLPIVTRPKLLIRMTMS